MTSGMCNNDGVSVLKVLVVGSVGRSEIELYDDDGRCCGRKVLILGVPGRCDASQTTEAT